jgi:hypothetical protein
MVEFHLHKILQVGMFNSFEEKAYRRLYEPEYHTFYFNENQFQSNTRFLVFNYKEFGFEYESGSISCCGVEIKLRSDKYNNILVSVGYDFLEKKLYNNILITPFYVASDFKGKRTIYQSAAKIYDSKDLTKYVKSINKRFNLTQ